MFWKRIRSFLSDNSMSLALAALFLVCLAGEGAVGWHSYDDSLAEAGLPRTGFFDYLKTGTFLDGVFSNWQAAILQLAILITFSSTLRQRGAAHSKKPEGEPEEKAQSKAQLNGERHSWVYRHSLSLAFFATFLLCFVLHAVFGAMKYNENALLRHEAAVSVGQYAASASFWFSVFQTWEAEFFAIGFYLILSIFLRQENSSESKPTDASDENTGETNK